MSRTRDYSVFGLRIRSELPLPELPGSSDGRPDVRIRTGSIAPAQRHSPGIHPTDGGTLLVVEDVGAYLVSGGREILVDALPGIPEENVRLFLLGSAFGILLHQRGLLPLHANAIQADGTAVAFTGPSGAGKSSLAAWFHDHGFRPIADDVCVLNFDAQGSLFAMAGIPRLRLWRDVLEATGRQAERFNRSYAGDESYDKFDVPIDLGTAPPDAVPVSAICLLDWGEEMRIEPVTGSAAADVVMANTYRGWLLQEPDDLRRHWSVAVRIAQQVPIFRFERPRGTLDGSGSFLRDWIARLADRQQAP